MNFTYYLLILNAGLHWLVSHLQVRVASVLVSWMQGNGRRWAFTIHNIIGTLARVGKMSKRCQEIHDSGTPPILTILGPQELSWNASYLANLQKWFFRKSIFTVMAVSRSVLFVYKKSFPSACITSFVFSVKNMENDEKLQNGYEPWFSWFTWFLTLLCVCLCIPNILENS